MTPILDSPRGHLGRCVGKLRLGTREGEVLHEMGEEPLFSNTMLKGKVVLITGGGSEICFEIAT